MSFCAWLEKLHVVWNILKLAQHLVSVAINSANKSCSRSNTGNWFGPSWNLLGNHMFFFVLSTQNCRSHKTIVAINLPSKKLRFQIPLTEDQFLERGKINFRSLQISEMQNSCFISCILMLSVYSVCFIVPNTFNFFCQMFDDGFHAILRFGSSIIRWRKFWVLTAVLSELLNMPYLGLSFWAHRFFKKVILIYWKFADGITNLEKVTARLVRS